MTDLKRELELRDEAIRRIDAALEELRTDSQAPRCSHCGCYVVWVNHYRRGWLCPRCRHFEAVRR